MKYIPGSTFFKDVLIAWAKFNYEFPTEEHEIMNQIIYLNSNIRRAGKPFRNQHLINSNIDKIYQLVDTVGKFKSNLELQQEFRSNLNDLDLNSIKAAIPVVWKQILRDPDIQKFQDQNITKYEKTKNQKLTQIIYWEQLRN